MRSGSAAELLLEKTVKATERSVTISRLPPRLPALLALAALALQPLLLRAAAGAFEGHGDVGATPEKGSVEFDASASTYRITGGGANMWADVDAFHFVWKRISGDVSITADVEFIGEGKVAHRKAALIVRQSLDAGAAYADVAVHGDGLTSLQYRRTNGAQTEEVRSELKGPKRLRLERRGNQFLMFLGEPGSELISTQAATVAMSDAVYVGLAVCSHDADVLETALFSNVKLEKPERPAVRTHISVYDLETKRATKVFSAEQHIEAPNWSGDGEKLLVNSGGNLYWLPLQANTRLEKINLSTPVQVNNDHAISPDGKLLAISGRPPDGRSSQVFTANIDGSNVKLITEKSPSYFHGFSPDGRWLAYTAQREGDYDLFRIPTAGGEEQRLNRMDGLDDGPDYSPDGKWIYTNSIRSGNFDIWRIPADGAGPGDSKAEQITNDEKEDWFPHPSPDSTWMVMVTFEKGTEGHPANRNVELRMIPMPGDTPKIEKPETIVKLFGGQGTINVNSWAPDSRKFAYVSYELVVPASSR